MGPENQSGCRVLIACDKFKHALNASQVSRAVARGIVGSGAFAADHLDLAPLTDGGEGFASLLTEAVRGVMVEREALGPRGEPVSSRFGLIDPETIPAPARALLKLPGHPRWLGIVEMASVAGIEQLSEAQRNPWEAHTTGVGQLLEQVEQVGAEAILLGIGGSATQDLGLGALSALGLVAKDRDGTKVDPLPKNWPRIHSFDRSRMRGLPPLRIACDVSHALLGEQGAVTVFGPQKGLLPEDVEPFDREAGRVARLLLKALGRGEEALDEAGAGAAGGMGFGLRAAYDAVFVPGFDLVSHWLRLPGRVDAADWVVSGEGGVDEGTFRGKGPGHLLKLARSKGKRALMVAGRITSEARRVASEEGLDLDWIEVTPPDMPLPEALKHSADLIEAAVRRKFSKP